MDATHDSEQQYPSMFWVRGPEPLDTDAVNEKEKKRNGDT